MKEKLIIIGGPTASGKTGYSIELAKKLDGEIVSCDSMQIYKYMDIGSAKPTEEEMQGIPHHMIGVIDPCVSFSVADYYPMATNCIDDILRRGKQPILCGGTGLYINAIINGLDFDDVDVDEAFRDELWKRYEASDAETIHSMLRECDPEMADKIHPNNVKRVIRAIEYFHTTGEKLSDYQKRTQTEKRGKYLYELYGIDMPRELLYERINKRVDIMIDDGLIDEVKSLLYEHNVPISATAMQGIGYKEIANAIINGTSIAEAIETVKQESRRYAKRQLTWFRRYKEMEWIDYARKPI